MRKKSRIVIIAIVLVLLSIKETSYYNFNLIEQCKYIVTAYSIDPSENVGKPPK